MWKFFGLIGTSVFLYTLSCTDANMDGGPGLWFVHAVDDCQNELPTAIANITVKKHKLNRTHDVYDAFIDVNDAVGIEGDGVLIDICKHTDGGCKQVQVLTDNDLAKFAEKYAEQNMIAAFTMAGIDPPRFPVQPGSYAVENFYFDHCEMPEESIYGEFTADAFIMRDSVKVACFRAHTEFREEEEDVCGRE